MATESRRRCRSFTTGTTGWTNNVAYTTSVDPTTWAAANNVSLNASTSPNVPNAVTVNSLRLTSAATVTLDGSFTLSSGGLLATGSGANTVTGGTLLGSGGTDLIIHQYSTSDLTINSTLADNVIVQNYCVIRNSTVGAGATLGPFAHIRPDSEVGDQVHIGNFVELKKARLGTGTKAGHLAYLGDATLGEQVNIGAGTITCNYDGKNKHETHIEDGVKIGSDTMLVAPVRVGRGSVTGAGTVVTKDVPPDSLAVGVPAVVKKKLK